MTHTQTRLARYLVHAGILPPWLALALHLVADVPGTELAALAYGAVIASFVCGMHWGLFMQARRPVPVNLLITSNAGALAAWLLLLAPLWSGPVAFVGLALVLGGLLFIDDRLLSAGVIEPWFWSIRRNASLGLGAAMVVWSVLA